MIEIHATTFRTFGEIIDFPVAHVIRDNDHEILQREKW